MTSFLQCEYINGAYSGEGPWFPQTPPYPKLLGLDYPGSTLDMGVGVIDAGYREPVDVILFNYSDQDNDETSSSS
jgi:hypothetical protein